MTKHFPLVGALALALSACASGPTADTRAVTASVPTNPLPVVGAEVLFWDDATRSARFRSMETYFPGQEVQESPDPRFLPQGDPLPANTQAAIRASMAGWDGWFPTFSRTARPPRSTHSFAIDRAKGRVMTQPLRRTKICCLRAGGPPFLRAS